MKKFNYDNENRTRYSQTFEKEKIIKKGQEICLYDLIQNSNVDTEIYPTLKKYNCIDYLKMDYNKVYGDITAIKGLRDVLEISKQTKKVFEGLPAEIKEKFKNNPDEFFKNGKQWLEETINKKNDAQQTETTQNTQIKNETKEANNE